MKRFDGDDSRSDGYHFHRGSGGQGMFPFLDGREVQQELLKRGVAVRYTGGLLRVTCGAPEENRAFLTKFAEILEETR